MMARMQLTGSYISNYPGIVEELKQKDIALRQVKHVDVTAWGSTFEVVATLRDGKTVPLDLATLVYHPQPTATMHMNEVLTLLHGILAKKQFTELDVQELERATSFLESITYYEVES